MAAGKIKVKIETENADLRKALEKLIQSEAGFNIQDAADTSRADLFVFELGDDGGKDFKLINSLFDLDAVGEVFLISKHSNPELLLKAMRSGAKEFFSQPIKAGEITRALKRCKKRVEKTTNREPAKNGRIVNVIGSKGGVGTTTVAVNLAVSLAEGNNAQSVALVDLNTLYGEIPIFLELKYSYHWGEITNNISRMDTTFIMNILSRHSTGVYVLPSPAYLNSNKPPTPNVMEHLLGHMQKMFDFVVVDGGLPSNETCLKTIELSEVVVLVTILTLPCLANTSKLLKSLYAMGYPTKERIKIVVNRYLKSSEISLKDAEAGIERKIFRTIPNDYQTTVSAINQGKPLSYCAPKAAITDSVRELANSLQEGTENQKKKSWKFLRRG
jgi:pilus assembly protein CpaE